MYGAIVGDVVGSCYEEALFLTGEEELFSKLSEFTDDSVLTCAVAESLVYSVPFEKSLRQWFFKHRLPGRYGGMFSSWCRNPENGAPKSNGNGAPMRVSPLALYYKKYDELMVVVESSTRLTHDHDEAVKGAQAIASCIHFAHKGESKADIQHFVEHEFGYRIRAVEEYVEKQTNGTSCEDTVPKAIAAALFADDFEMVLRNCLKIGGDVDTIMAMAGGIAEVLYGIPEKLLHQVKSVMTPEMLEVMGKLYFLSGREVNVVQEVSEQRKDTEESGSQVWYVALGELVVAFFLSIFS